MIYLAAAALILSFAVLFKCADLFVDGSAEVARILDLPKLIIGIVLVGLATTAPEFAVSVNAAFRNHPEIALGNAIGSVIADDCLALGLAAFFACGVIYVNCRMLKLIGIFLLSIDLLAYFLARNGLIGRWEGLLLVSLLVLYFTIIFRSRHYERRKYHGSDPEAGESGSACPRGERKAALKKPVLYILLGLGGVVATSEVIVRSAVFIAEYFAVSEIIIGSTVIAIGTSLPEISTCITAARKGEGEIAVGNILGADVLNILWIVGMAAVVNPIHVEPEIVNFKFPFMILVVLTMLIALRIGCRHNRFKGLILLAMYAVYLYLTITLFI
jgi:cation:H+ antiporter